jgi:hypothetical protein
VTSEPNTYLALLQKPPQYKHGNGGHGGHKVMSSVCVFTVSYPHPSAGRAPLSEVECKGRLPMKYPWPHYTNHNLKISPADIVTHSWNTQNKLWSQLKSESPTFVAPIAWKATANLEGVNAANIALNLALLFLIGEWYCPSGATKPNLWGNGEAE